MYLCLLVVSLLTICTGVNTNLIQKSDLVDYEQLFQHTHDPKPVTSAIKSLLTSLYPNTVKSETVEVQEILTSDKNMIVFGQVKHVSGHNTPYNFAAPIDILRGNALWVRKSAFALTTSEEDARTHASVYSNIYFGTTTKRSCSLPLVDGKVPKLPLANSRILQTFTVSQDTGSRALKEPYLSKIIVLYRREVASVGKFGFAVCAIVKGFDRTGVSTAKPADEFLVLGFGQESTTTMAVEHAMLAYLAHPDAFGLIVALPTLFSGSEVTDKATFDYEIASIKQKLPQEYNNANLTVLRAWSTNNEKKNATHKQTTVGIFELCASNEDPKYFFADKENSFIGTFQKTEISVMLTLVDYLRPLHLTDIMQLPEDKFWKEGMDSDVHKIVYCADFICRKLSGNDRSDKDRTPLVNKAFGAAKALLKKQPNLDVNTLLVLLLHDAFMEKKTTEKEILEHFPFLDQSIKLLTAPTDENIKKPVPQNLNVLYVANFARFENLEATAYFEGYEKETSILSLLKLRRKKAFEKQKLEKSPPEFKLKLKETFCLDKILFGILELKENGDKGGTYFFSMQLCERSDTRQMEFVVGELGENDPGTIKRLIVEDYNRALLYESATTDGSASSEEAKNSEKVIVVNGLELAGRAHGGIIQRRKDVDNSPYIFHVVGVALLLLREGLLKLATSAELVKVINAALLHDSVENTSVVSEQLADLFSSDVANWVAEVTDKTVDANGRVLTAQEKKLTQEQKALTQSPVAVLLKMADRIHNLRDFLRLLPAAVPENRRRLNFDSTVNLVNNFQKNVQTHATVWTGFEGPFTNLNAVLDGLLKLHNGTFLPPGYSPV